MGVFHVSVLHEQLVILCTEPYLCRWAVGLFFYQTFDAIDGYVTTDGTASSVGLLKAHRKQARRTGMAGPLGEMFDHGACLSNDVHEMSIRTQGPSRM